MKREIKEKWVAALRSGHYVQGGTCLKYLDDTGKPRHCCLGVLAEVAEPWGLTEHGRNVLFYDSNIYLMLPNKDWAFLPGETQSRLAKMNDNGDSFLTIADWIETNVREED
jgi:hypothetical protein